MHPRRVDYTVRSWQSCEANRERITFVDHLGRVMHVTLTRQHALDGGAHAAILARIAAAGDRRQATR